MKKNAFSVVAILLMCGAFGPQSGQAQQESNKPAGPPAQAATPQFDQWGDEFTGTSLDETKWERFTFEGGGGGKVELKDGQLHLRSASKTRAGVRSKPTFNADHFSVEALVARVGPQMPDPGDKASPLGFAAMTVMFDGSGRNRIEWIFTS